MDKTAVLQVRIRWNLDRGKVLGVEEIDLELTDTSEEAVRDVILSRGKPAVRRFLQRFIETQGFAGPEYRDPMITTIEFLVVEKKYFETLSSLDIQTEFNELIVKQLRQRSHNSEYR